MTFTDAFTLAFWNAGKSVLLSDLAGAPENGTLGILQALPMRDLLLEELASFETKTTPAGNSVTRLDRGDESRRYCDRAQPRLVRE